MNTYIVTKKEKGQNAEETTIHTIIEANELKYGYGDDETACFLKSNNNTCLKEIVGLFRDFDRIIQIPESISVEQYLSFLANSGKIENYLDNSQK